MNATDCCPYCNRPYAVKRHHVPLNAVKRLRHERHLSMRELADMAGISTRTTVWRMEHGKDVALSSAVAIARALRVTVDALIDETEGGG